MNPEVDPGDVADLWVTVLLVGLLDPDADEWVITDDAATVCELAGFDHDAVLAAHFRGRVRSAFAGEQVRGMRLTREGRHVPHGC